MSYVYIRKLGKRASVQYHLSKSPSSKSEFYTDLGGIQKKNLYWDSRHVGTSKHQRAPGVSRARSGQYARTTDRQHLGSKEPSEDMQMKTT